ncbi:MAG: saccharopine dehydrogenase, partial [Cryomorphaceae bacterium]|nr:saccharopine dehydrogenase [Cryomorphaceae bacterium]MBT7383665.1 saccharopine dehydrogenase [Cryomorphaceae bacterium]MBT7545856.1 saccharopine dehydrogenase [Cryomorphaceae bacterium]
MKREFDIIIWGASGFTGRLVAEYLFKKYKSNDLKWAIAGRDESKLISIREDFLDNSIPIL